MVKFFRNNIGYPATAGFIHNGLPSFNDKVVKGYTYNNEKVRQLLLEDGFTDGKGLPENIDFRNTESLGLQLVVSLVEQINGKIKLDTKKGTNFTIEFSGNPANA